MATDRRDPSTDGLDLDLGFTVGLGMAFETGVQWAGDQGFEYVELLLDGQYARPQIEDRRESMVEALTTACVGLVVHLPFSVEIGSPFPPIRNGVVDEFTAGMDLAADLGASKVVFHPSTGAWDRGWTREERLTFVHAALDDLIPAALDRGLEPCLENVVTGYYDVGNFPELLEQYPRASMTFDTSHALLAGMDESEMAEFCREYADRIAHLHLVDTRGDVDEHLPVGMGRIDFGIVLSGLAEAGWSGTATLEIDTEDYATIALGRRNLEDVLGTG